MANTWRNKAVRSQDMCQIMRDINALQAAATGWRVVGLIGSPFGNAYGGHETAGGTYIAATDSGAIYVSDSDYIKRFNTDGNFAWKVAVNTGTGVCCDGAENVFVHSSIDDLIYKYDSAGTLLTSFSAAYPDPRNMACDLAGNVYLRYSSNNIAKWSNTGTLQWALGFAAVGLNTAGLTVDDSSILHATVSAGGVVRIDSAGTVLGTYGSTFYNALASDGPRIFAGKYQGAYGIDIFTKAGALSESTLLPLFAGSPTANSNLGGHCFAVGLSIASSAYGTIFATAPGGTVQKWTEGQTKFYGYATDARVSFGTPDAGATIPNLNALSASEAGFDYHQIVDCQVAIQGLTRLYNYGDGYPFTFIPWNVSATVLTMGSTVSGGIGFTCNQDLPINEYLTVSGVTGTTNANGTWRVVVGGGFYDYALEGAVYNAAWTGGGTITDPRNLYAGAMGDRTAYGATGGTAYGWTRCGRKPAIVTYSFGPCQGPAVVAGTDGLQYYCIAAHAASAATKPITGGSYATYWAKMRKNIEAAPAWAEGMGYNTYPWTVTGTDGNFYYCDRDHVSSAATRPITGANWQGTWKQDNRLLNAGTWTDATNYSSSNLYDIDIGELRECVDLLLASTPL